MNLLFLNKIIFLVFFLSDSVTLASVGPELTWVSDQIEKNPIENSIKLIGKAEASQGNQKLMADSIIIDFEKGKIQGKGNCRYLFSGRLVNRQCSFTLSQMQWKPALKY